MEKYRKPDQEYIDDYDRYTIQKLKELEKEYPNASINDPLAKFFNRAVDFAQNKNEFIRKRKNEDDRKDMLVANATVPRNVKCTICDAVMLHENHLFEENGTLLFVFNCVSPHPKKVLLLRRLCIERTGGSRQNELITALVFFLED